MVAPAVAAARRPRARPTAWVASASKDTHARHGPSMRISTSGGVASSSIWRKAVKGQRKGVEGQRKAVEGR